MSCRSNAHSSPNSAAAVTTSGYWANNWAISSPERRCAPPSGASQPAASSRTAGRGWHPSPSPAAPATVRRSARRWWRPARHRSAARARPARRCARRRAGDRDGLSSTLTRSAPNRSTRSASAAAAASGPPRESASRTCPLRHPVRICQCPPRGLGERVEVVAGFPLLAAGQVRGGQLTGQPAVALRPAGQHQQVRTGRIRNVRTRRRQPSDSSAPNTVRMSSSRAASAKRTTP